MKNKLDQTKAREIKADIYSRNNALNGKYDACQLGFADDMGTDDIFFLETIKMKADLADKMISEAESQGKDTTDPNVMKELGEKINASGKPLHKSESSMTAIFSSLQFIILYGIAIGIWGLFFKKSFFIFGLYGVILGLLISLLFVGPVVARQRTKEQIRNTVDGAGLMWGSAGIVIGVAGLIAWVIRLVIKS